MWTNLSSVNAEGTPAERRLDIVGVINLTVLTLGHANLAVKVIQEKWTREKPCILGKVESLKLSQ